MKLIKSLITVLSISVIFSCVTTDSGISNNETPSVEGKVIEKSPEKKMVEKTIEEKVYFVTKEKAFYGDGQLDSITEYVWDDNLNLLEKIQKNEQEEVLESHKYIFENGLKVKEESYGFGNSLSLYTLYEYNEMGNIVKETSYDKDKNIQSINEFEYDSDKLIIWKTLGPNGGVLAVTTYTWDKGLNVKVEMKDGGGVIDGIIEKLYENGLISKELIKDSKGKIEKSAIYSYTDGNLIDKQFLDEKGKIRRSESYLYSESMIKPNRVNQNFASGAVEAYTEFEYDTKVITKSVMVEE